jgi:hypothetical protein
MLPHGAGMLALAHSRASETRPATRIAIMSSASVSVVAGRMPSLYGRRSGPPSWPRETHGRGHRPAFVAARRTVVEAGDEHLVADADAQVVGR